MKSIIIIIIIIMIIIIIIIVVVVVVVVNTGFSRQHELMVFHWSLSDS